MRIRIEDIKIRGRRRSVNVDKVKELSESIKSCGLLQPIIITNDGYLVAGMHRKEACVMLGMTEIDVISLELDTLQAELAEIDENLIRNELNFIERGEVTARRKVIYEEMYPDTRKGVIGAIASNKVQGKDAKSTVDVASFVTDTARKTGLSPTTIREEIRIAEKLIPELKEKAVKGKITKRQAIEFSRKSADEQMEIANKPIKKIKSEKKEVKSEKSSYLLANHTRCDNVTVMVRTSNRVRHWVFGEPMEVIIDAIEKLGFKNLVMEG